MRRLPRRLNCAFPQQPTANRQQSTGRPTTNKLDRKQQSDIEAGIIALSPASHATHAPGQVQGRRKAGRQAGSRQAQGHITEDPPHQLLLALPLSSSGFTARCRDSPV